jgi:peptide/nickel transport system permease protein
LSGHPLGPTIAGGVIILIVLVAIFAPLLTPSDPNEVSILDSYLPPSSDHLLGTDASGRDLLSRLITGSRTALLGPLIVVLISTPLGVGLAILAAWSGGWIDTVISRSIDVVFAFPGLLLAIIAAAVFGPSLMVAAIALSISYTPYTARVVRSEAIRQRRQPYVEALWIQGHSTTLICWRHLLPNLMPLILAQLTLSFAYATVDIATISFLGLGVQPPTPDWGTMVAEGQVGILEGFPQESLYASACLVTLILAVSVVGDYLTDRAEQRR